MQKLDKNHYKCNHCTGPANVTVNLVFCNYFNTNPKINFIETENKKNLKLDIPLYIAEIFEGVSIINNKHNTDFGIDQINIRVDDYPSKGQVKYVTTLILEEYLKPKY